MNVLKKTYQIFGILLVACTLGATLQGRAQGNYQYVKEITINGSQVQGSHTNFPLLIDITDANLQANVQNSNGYDIIFATDPDGNNVLDHQIESYNASNGNLVSWVRIPNLSSSTTIYMLYGNASVTSDPSTSNTWDNNFKVVQHFNANNLADATNNANNGLNNGTTSILGKLGTARDFDGNSNIEIPNSPTLNISGPITISMWVYNEDTNGGWFPLLLSKGAYNESYSVADYYGNNYSFILNGSYFQSNTSSSTGSWQYLTFIKDNNGRNIYINSSLDATDGNSPPIQSNNSVLKLSGTGALAFDGRLDEVRISNTARSADWIATQYNNQNNPENFYTLGSQQQVQNNGVAVTKTVNNGNPEEQETITYTITAANDGEIPVSGVEIEDNLPQGLTFVSATASQGTYNNTSGNWDIGSLPTSTSATLTIQAEVQFGQEGNTITNTASLSAIDQTDENAANNSDDAPISVQFSGSGPPPSSCDGLPTLTFQNGSLISGSSGQVGAVYRYDNVLTGTYATITITDVNNATLENPDQFTGNNEAAFKPIISNNYGQGHIDFEIKFFDAGTGTPKTIDRFRVSATDVDGDGGNRHELVGFASSASYTLGTTTLLNTGFDAPFDIFEPQNNDNFSGSDPLDYPEGMVSLEYKNVTSFQLRGGVVNYTGSGPAAERQFTVDFNPCVPESFPNNPQPVPNNADVGVSKTVDKSNPDENETISYTIDVQNYGPEKATSVLVKDPLPNGITYSSASATKGTYNPTSGEWDIGDIPNGNSETLTITATVNQGTAGNTINNIARIDGLNQTDPNTGNQQSNVEINVTSGVKVSGTVFSDNNHNGTNESSESGISGVTIVLLNTNNTTCQSVQTDGNGNYEFSNIPTGNYKVVEAANESTPAPGSCPPTATDPSGYVSTTANTKPITVNNNPIIQQFGDFEGSKVQGIVFNDNGTGGGTANDGLQNGGETGIDGVTVEATDNSGTVLKQTTTAGDGSYTMFLPASTAPDGSTIKIKETNKAGFLSVAGNAGTTGGNYDRPNDEISFTNNTGTIYTGLLFSDVNKSLLYTDGQKNLSTGSSGTFPHKFTAKTDGDVTFSIQSTNNPSSNDFSPILYQDNDCNQTIDNGEPILTNSDILSVTKGQTECLLLKVVVPQNASNGDTGTLTLNASFTLANTSPVVQQTASRNDVINVTESNSGLSLSKSVDKSQALPGELITYTITYSNNGTQPINSLEVTDNVPAYTTYSSSNCNPGSLPNNLTGCNTTSPGVGNTGTITWTFSGSLQPGESGTIIYKVQIQN
ncbi:conserved repeat domain-containing protein [Fodinibius salinus]|uniref:Conserved repeat domain-containing protein n=1 Tax=Fodinibius salinus TaxID=860790 RepID=A0A5D3YJZ3_9BACT|nr:DUF2341 domain-containing protein [Fodinibius salinus]TYP93828.1 conserved repeat domain-containing protein [Fodinibius salinus]